LVGGIKLKEGFLKRFFDLFLSVPAFFVFSPALIGIAVLLRTTMGVPFLFRQVRPGLQGRPFTIYKFRTMRDVRDEKNGGRPESAG